MPTAVEIEGIEYPINSDFRVSVRILTALEDKDLTFLEKKSIILANLYDNQPEDTKAALELAAKFLNGGKVNDREDSLRLFSFAKDSDLIFAAFMQTHRIDLQTADIHWWKFLALFSDLGSDTAFCSLVGLRSRIKNGTATREEREAANSMGDAFIIEEPDNRTLEEREKDAEFLSLLKVGG